MSEYFDVLQTCQSCSQADKDTVLRKCNETQMWLEANKQATGDEYDRKLKECENVCAPIISRFMGPRSGQDTNAGGVRGGTENDGPRIEEMD